MTMRNCGTGLPEDMDPKLLNLAAHRARGPTGVGPDLKQGISWTELYRWLPNDLGEKLVAQIFFLVDDDLLDQKDGEKLDEVAASLVPMVEQGHKVGVRCIGRADVSYKPDYNLDLAKRRAKEVAEHIKTAMGLAPPTTLHHTGTGEAHSRSEKRYWLEDRRVDVIAHVEPQYTYKFDYYCNNKNEFRPYIFRTYYPRYWLWRSRRLDYLIDQFEDENRPGGSGSVTIRKGDYGKALQIVEMLADYGDWKNIQEWMKKGSRVAHITTAYEVEYRRAYQIAYERAQKDFRRSNFQSSCEFFSIKFGLVPRNTPYKLRPGKSALRVLEKEYKYKGSTSHRKT